MPLMASCVVPVMAMWTLEHVFPMNGSLGWRESDAESIAGGSLRRRSDRTYNGSFFPAFLSPAAIPGHQSSPKPFPGRPHGKSRSQRSNDLEHELGTATNLSILQLNITRLRRQDSRREQLLALFSLR
jgi:hypothetical protein